MPVAVAILTLPLLLVAAKAHGRQVRLERERAGYHDVVFGGENAPFVEALWRRDRVAFWTAAPLAMVTLGALAWLAGWGAWAWLALPGGMSAAFVGLGLASARRTRDPKGWLWAAAGLLTLTCTAAFLSA